jgi:hypothetical protein
MTSIETITDKALDAFWAVIVEEFPTATTGDLSPLATFHLSQAAEAAVREWIANNVKTQECHVAPGYRFRLFREIDRFPDFRIPKDLTGVVTVVDDAGVWGRIDQHIAGAEEWDNQIHWESPYDFASDTIPA